MNSKEKVDWSIDQNREQLRESVRRREHEIAALFDVEGAVVTAFYEQFGIGQYSAHRFVDFLADQYPEQLEQSRLKLARSSGRAGQDGQKEAQ